MLRIGRVQALLTRDMLRLGPESQHPGLARQPLGSDLQHIGLLSQQIGIK